MKNIIICLILSIAVFTGCDSTNTESSKQTSTVNIAASQISKSKTTMLFFINPNGRPCKIQLAILDEIKDKMQEMNIKLQLVSTQELQSAKPLFERYGIRALPTIILIDKTGKEKKRFAPGVQSKVVLLSAMKRV